jgi:DUF4097 and DUF4098 domain-containing protein YvlB
MTVLLTAAFAAAVGLAAPADQAREARAPQTDQTVPVSRGGRLRVNNFAGETVVRVWEKDAVRVLARHSARVRVDVRQTDGGVSLSASAERGPSSSVDYEITAPAWLPIRVDGTYNFVSIEGTQAEVAVENVRGDIVIKGGSGFVTAKSVEGEILVERAKGRLSLSGVNEDIRVSGASGDIVAETTNGGITLTSIESSSVEATTVNGDILFEGTANRGAFRFASHNGDIVIAMPETASATIVVRSYQGDFASTLPVKGPPASEVERGRRVSYTLGGGAADVEVETFGGDIRLRRPSEVQPDREQSGKAKDKDKTKDKGPAEFDPSARLP